MRLGISIWNQGATWAEIREAGLVADKHGFEYLFTFDHLLANLGDPFLPVYDGWLVLAAWAAMTERSRLGLLVGSNTFRNPALLAKMVVTLDHLSGGRAVLGLGSGWYELEHRAYGIEFGSSFRERGSWLNESLDLIEGLLTGRGTSYAGTRYTAEVRLVPPPLQPRIPVVVGGMGTSAIRAVARHADIWSLYTVPDDILRARYEQMTAQCVVEGRAASDIRRAVSCKVVIRDNVGSARSVWQATLRHHRIKDYQFEPWLGPPEAILDRADHYKRLGFDMVIVDALAPFDFETIDRIANEVMPVLAGWRT